MNIGYKPFYGSGFNSVKPVTKSVSSNMVDNRQQLSNVLFGKSVNGTSSISFGWSKGLNREELEILDLLTNPLTRNVMVGTHIKPDADATGSAVGISGVLRKLGTNVFPVLDDFVPSNLKSLPTPDRSTTQEYFFKTSNQIKDLMEHNHVDNLDVAVLTDCALPKNISKSMLKLATQAKSIVVIDHHCGKKPSEHYRAWLEAIVEANPKFDEDRFYYWCEPDRSSASEMVAEIDKEVYDEYVSNKKDEYSLKQRYNKRMDTGYRYSVAAGILDDSGARLNSNSEIPKFPRSSNKTVKFDRSTKMNSTEAYYRWLVGNAGNAKVNLKKVNNNDNNKDMNNLIYSILEGKKVVDNMYVKAPDLSEKYGVVDLTSSQSLDTMLNSIDSDAKTNDDLVRLFKLRAIDKINAGESELFVIASTDSKTGNVVIGAYSADNIAIKIINELIEQGYGEGGGHDCACVIRMKPGEVLDENKLNLIESVVKEHNENKDLKENHNLLPLLYEYLNAQSGLMMDATRKSFEASAEAIEKYFAYYVPAKK